MADNTLAFLAVCTHGSFLAAGQALGLATSTVSRRVSQLEERLGAKLLDRNTHGVELTEAGRVYQARAACITDVLTRAEEAVHDVMHQPRGRLRIAAPSPMVRGPVGRVVRSYLQDFPDVRLEVVSTDELPEPDGESLHLVIRASHALPPPALTRVRLGDVSMRLLATPDYLGREGPITHPDALRTRGCVVLGGDTNAADIQLTRGDERHHLTVGVALFTTSISLARSAGLDGVGPVGLPDKNCQDLVRSGALVDVLPDYTLQSVPVVLLYAGDRRLPIRMRTFIDRLRAAFAQVD